MLSVDVNPGQLSRTPASPAQTRAPVPNQDLKLSKKRKKMTPPEAPKNDEIGAAGAEKVKNIAPQAPKIFWKKHPKNQDFSRFFRVGSE